MESIVKKYTSEHVISDDAFDHISSELLKENLWIGYNTASYFLDKNDVYFFINKEEANDFAESNISEYDNYRMIKANSADDVLKQIPYGEQRLNMVNEQKEIQDILVGENHSLYNQLKKLGFSNKLIAAISFP